jgi:hypothetical protein
VRLPVAGATRAGIPATRQAPDGARNLARSDTP